VKVESAPKRLRTLSSAEASAAMERAVMAVRRRIFCKLWIEFKLGLHLRHVIYDFDGVSQQMVSCPRVRVGTTRWYIPPGSFFTIES
jgi:hypothetical protein